MIHITSHPFGKLTDGRDVVRYIMMNESGMQVAVIGFGCAVQSILVPDKDSVLRDVALGYDTASYYEKGSCYLGAFIGRYANRIRGARFPLNGKIYQLKINDGKNHLHGAFAHRLFEGMIREGVIAFPFVSRPHEEGYPGTLTGEVIYRLTEDNALEIEYTATCDEDTVINLTNHTYFNLNGNDGSDILDHTLAMDCERFTGIDGEHLATGSILPVGGTPFDFRCEKEIGAEILSEDQQLRLAGGYDHNFILNGSTGTLRKFAEAGSHRTGIVLTAYTTEPGVQFYTGNYIHEDAAPYGKNGVRYPRFGGFCLEAQRFPDSVNHPEFPPTVLRKGEVYRQKTIYRFTVSDPSER